MVSVCTCQGVYVLGECAAERSKRSNAQPQPSALPGVLMSFTDFDSLVAHALKLSAKKCIALVETSESPRLVLAVSHQRTETALWDACDARLKQLCYEKDSFGPDVWDDTDSYRESAREMLEDAAKVAAEDAKDAATEAAKKNEKIEDPASIPDSAPVEPAPKIEPEVTPASTPDTISENPTPAGDPMATPKKKTAMKISVAKAKPAKVAKVKAEKAPKVPKVKAEKPAKAPKPPKEPKVKAERRKGPPVGAELPERAECPRNGCKTPVAKNAVSIDELFGFRVVKRNEAGEPVKTIAQSHCRVCRKEENAERNAAMKANGGVPLPKKPRTPKVAEVKPAKAPKAAKAPKVVEPAPEPVKKSEDVLKEAKATAKAPKAVKVAKAKPAPVAKPAKAPKATALPLKLAKAPKAAKTPAKAKPVAKKVAPKAKAKAAKK